ncbi:FAD-dependent oxidoreductase, partial [Streptomyces albus]
MTEPRSDHSADVIVVGAGPAGSATAYHLAKAGLD